MPIFRVDIVALFLLPEQDINKPKADEIKMKQINF
jgi:hypothetical protein